MSVPVTDSLATSAPVSEPSAIRCEVSELGATSPATIESFFISGLATAPWPTSATFTSPSTMSSENTVFEPSSA